MTSSLEPARNNLAHCFYALGMRPKTAAAVAFETVSNCFEWFELAGVDVAAEMQDILKTAGMTPDAYRAFILRNRDVKEGDTVEMPYAPPITVTAQDIAIEDERRIVMFVEQVQSAFAYASKTPKQLEREELPSLSPAQLHNGMEKILKVFNCTSLGPAEDHIEQIMQRAGVSMADYDRLFANRESLAPALV